MATDEDPNDEDDPNEFDSTIMTLESTDVLVGVVLLVGMEFQNSMDLMMMVIFLKHLNHLQ